LPSLTTPQTSVDLTTISDVSPPAMPEPDIFEPSQDTFKDIVDKIKEQYTFQNVEGNKIQINQTKQERKEEKQRQQQEKQQKKELKKQNKMQRAIRKIQALNEIIGIKNKLINKGKLFKQGLRNSDRISVLERKSSLRSSSPTRESGTPVSPFKGGEKMQKGGGDIDTLMGNKLEELYQEINIIAYMNQIYSDTMPYELLLILLTDFNFEYSGVSDASGNMVPLSELPENLSYTTPDYYPMVLSRGEYLLKFQTDLSNLISNQNIGLTEEQKQMLESFTKVVSPVVPEATDETTVEYNTEALEEKLGSENFNLTPIIERMGEIVLTKKNVPCFLSVIDESFKIKDYLRDMGKIWLTILEELSKKPIGPKDLVPDRKIIFDITKTGVLPYSGDRRGAEGLSIPNTEVKNSLQRIHLITALLTFNAEKCILDNPLPENKKISSYIEELNTVLKLDELCREKKPDNNLLEIKNLILKLRTYNEKIYTIIIYLLTIIGAILFDVTKPYFPCQIKEYTISILKTIDTETRLTGGEKTVGVTNEQIFQWIVPILTNLLDNKLPKTKDEIKCADETCVNPTKGMCTIMGGSKTKKNRKHPKNRSLRFK